MKYLIIQIIAMLLLIFRLWGTKFIVRAIQAQFRLMKYPAMNDNGEQDAHVMHFRTKLNRLAIIMLGGQVIPIVYDLLHILSPGFNPLWFIILYAVSNCISAFAASLMLWNIYEMAM